MHTPVRSWLRQTYVLGCLGLAGLFLEAHPNPDAAKCDGPSALPLDKLEPFLAQMKAVDEIVKNLPELVID